VVQEYARRVKAGLLPTGSCGRREKFCPLKYLLSLTDAADLAQRTQVHEAIRGIERDVPHGLALFKHLMGLDVGVSEATLSRARQAALGWLRQRVDYDLAVAAWLR
jgi:hypothetical protein